MEQLDLVTAHHEMLRRGADVDILVSCIRDELGRLEQFFSVGRHVAGETRGLVLLIIHSAPRPSGRAPAGRAHGPRAEAGQLSRHVIEIPARWQTKHGRGGLRDIILPASQLQSGLQQLLLGLEKAVGAWFRINSSFDISLHLANASRQSGVDVSLVPAAESREDSGFRRLGP